MARKPRALLCRKPVSDPRIRNLGDAGITMLDQRGNTRLLRPIKHVSSTSNGAFAHGTAT
jgi:hypothetical protein